MEWIILGLAIVLLPASFTQSFKGESNKQKNHEVLPVLPEDSFLMFAPYEGGYVYVQAPKKYRRFFIENVHLRESYVRAFLDYKNARDSGKLRKDQLH